MFATATTATNVLGLKSITKQDLVADIHDGRLIPDLLTGIPSVYGRQGKLAQFTDVVPPGTIMLYTNAIDNYKLVPEDSWVLCDGAFYGIDDPRYTRLFKVIGFTYGIESAGAQFHVPNIPPLLVTDNSSKGAGTALMPAATVYNGLTGKIGGFPDTNGAAFNVEISNNKYSVTLASTGIGYTTLTQVSIPGNLFVSMGGETPKNDILVTVLNTGTDFSITGYSYQGIPPQIGISVPYLIKL